MINTKELRRGNLVQTVYTVSLLIEVHAIYIAGIRDRDRVSYMSEEITGIPIDEDWLKRLGFAYTEAYAGKGFRNGNMIVYKVRQHVRSEEWFYEVEYSSDKFEDREPIVPRIDYVHQFQNLYYALTGSELAIREEAGK